jgi:hypothetical protein
MRVPVSRLRPSLVASRCETPVGGFGLTGEFELCLAERLGGRPDAGLALAPWGAGGELELAQLLAGQGGPAEGVVLSLPSGQPYTPLLSPGEASSLRRRPGNNCA